ncbi:MAG: hypothetical protein HQL06_08135 [Nitrospirae bacterium]|nr:hypothetical protein [Nitrospirota bacterium]
MKKLHLVIWIIMFVFVGTMYGVNLSYGQPNAGCETKKVSLDNFASNPQYGKAVSSASGTIEYCRTMSGKFSVKLDVKGLTPNAKYRMSINGYPNKPGNQNLCEKNGNERFCDFGQFTTNSSGNYSGSDSSTSLKQGEYDIKFLIKDESDWKCVLQNTMVQFTIQ